jgi:hypothetical protein
MGLIGEYIVRIFLGMSNNPQFVVRQIDGYDQGLRQGNEPDGYPVRKEEAIS